MAKNRRRGKESDEGLGPVRPRPSAAHPAFIVPPTGDTAESYRYASWVRDPRLSFEVYCKNAERRVELGLPAIYVEA